MKAARHDAVVCGSSWMTRDFHSRLGIKTQLVRNGVDLDACPSVPLDVRRLAGWPADTDVVSFVGRLQHWKGPDVFIRAAAEVAQRFRRARFLVVGDALYGWEEGYAAGLHELARRAGLGGKLYFAGHRDEALGLMAGSDVVVHCSRRPEPLGMVVAEAMALGRAVVATKTRGPQELIMPGRTGLLVAPGDVGALAASVGDLLADANQRSALGQAAAQAVAEDWSGEAMAAGFASIYRRLVDNGRGDPRAQPSRRADDG
jgi:glycosyltransferase involved in cell wall biosynthesis